MTSARGLRRRQLLLETAGELLMEHGFAAVSHRAVAQHADLPLSATTYYFTSLDDLLAGAVRQLADGWLAGAGVVVADLPPHLDDPRALAEALVRVAALGPAGRTGTDSPTLLSLYDRYVEAARHPCIRPLVAEYGGRIEALLADVLRRSGSPDATTDDLKRVARLVLAVIDGALLRALAEATRSPRRRRLWSSCSALSDCREEAEVPATRPGKASSSSCTGTGCSPSVRVAGRTRLGRL